MAIENLSDIFVNNDKDIVNLERCVTLKKKKTSQVSLKDLPSDNEKILHMIIFFNTVPQPAVNPFYRDCSEIERAVGVFLMIYSLIQFQSFCNPCKLADKWSSV